MKTGMLFFMRKILIFTSNEPCSEMLAFLNLANTARVKYPAACGGVFDCK